MRRMFLSVIFALLALPPGALSQSSNQDSTIAELQATGRDALTDG